MSKCCVPLFIVAISVATFAFPSDQIQNTIKEKYRDLEVGVFTVEKGVELPTDYFAALPEQIVMQCRESKLFDKVSIVSANNLSASSANGPVLRMTGVITAFQAGSRKGRYFGGALNPGANTQIYAYVQYVDATTGALISENEVVGTLSSGLGGGNSKNVVHEFATSLVETTKFIILSPPLSSSDTPPKVAEDAPHETIELSDANFEEARSKVNDLASQGYRLVSFKSTGYQAARLLMAKTSDIAQYQYAFFKAMLPTSVQKDLSRKSQEGYRYRPHTMIMLKNHVFVIAERDSAAPPVHYEYRLHATMRESSAEKDIREDQAQGFVLIDCRRTTESHHMLLMERKSEK